MKLNARYVSELRKRWSWTQDELATAAGLNLRTVQRIENEGRASLQSTKALAAALNVGTEELEKMPEKTVTRYEYKTLVLPFRFGLFKRGIPDVKQALDAEGRQGWQLKQMVLPSSDWGKSDCMVAILERVLEGVAG